MEQPERVEHYGMDDSVTDPHSGTYPEVAIGGQTTLETAVGTFTVVGAPGHSPGSTMLFLGETCFGGDVLFRGGIGRTDLPGSNPHSMKSTLADVVKKLSQKTMILPGHGPSTSIGEEVQQNPFLRGL